MLGDLSGKRVLEIGCGSGRSMQYAADKGATDLWGLDLAAGQIARAESFLKSQGNQGTAYLRAHGGRVRGARRLL